MSLPPSRQPATLSTCDAEPIHIPGSIQKGGCLLACDPGDFVITRASENSAALLGFGRPELTGAELQEVVGASVAHEIRNSLSMSPDPARPGLLFRLPIGSAGTFDIVAHLHNRTVIIEILPAPAEADPASLELARSLIRRLSTETQLPRLLQTAPKLLRAGLGYDRVMVYRFAADGAGQVVSEAKRHDLESFSGQWFPASDIPQQARALYLRNTIRVVVNSDCDVIPIKPDLNAAGEALDLSYAHLRSVSPIHCEYLRNMGVAASMSISIIVDGKLWGLIACHHYSPRGLSLGERMNVELVGDCFSMQVQSLLSRERLQASANVRAAIDALLQNLVGEDDPDFVLRTRIGDLAEMIESDGTVLWLDGRATHNGLTLPDAVLADILKISAQEAPGRVWCTNRLATHVGTADLGGLAGVLAIPLSQATDDCLFYLRKEVVETIEWGGDPNKAYTSGPLGDRLTPRVSFAIWKDEVRDQSVPWSSLSMEAAESIRIGLREIILRQTDMLLAERRQADARQKLLNDELNHRVKNILALIQSLLRQSREDGRSLADYVATLEGRIMALAKAHDQVWQGDKGGRLDDLLATEFTPYRERGTALSENGPPVVLDARAYSVLALVVHELATNAAKYGALSVPGGRLSVDWDFNADGDCVLNWSETGGPPIRQPVRKGFGSTLIDRSIPYDLRGEARITYPPEGLQAMIRIPAVFVSSGPAAAREPKNAASEASPKLPLKGKTVLVVEDQFIVAFELENTLMGFGAEAVGVAASADDALAKISDGAPDIALLDVNLGGGSSIRVAEALMQRGVPLMFTTGYADNAHIPAELSQLPVIRKPYAPAALASALERLLRGRAV